MAARYQQGSFASGKICEICTQNTADFFCECSGSKKYFCEGCFPKHIRKYPGFQHNLILAGIDASDVAGIQARAQAFAAGKTELLQNLNAIDQCCSELESIVQRLNEYLQEQLTQLRTLQATLAADIEDSVREVESTLAVQEVRLQGKYSDFLRNYTPDSLCLFHYRLDPNFFNSCCSSLLTYTLENPIAQQAHIQGTLFRLAFDRKKKMDGKLQVLDIDSRTWAPPQSPTLQMEVDYFTCYAFATETAVVLCGSGRLPGTSVYRVEFAGSSPTVTALSRFPERRLFEGLYVYEKVLFAFGGLDSTATTAKKTANFADSADFAETAAIEKKSKNDALSLSLSAPRKWQRVSGQMSENKVQTTPCRLNLKLYISQRQIDVFNLQSSAFEQPLALQLPKEDYLSRVAFFSSNSELIIISYRNTFRIDITQSRMTQEEHEEMHILPASPVVLKGDSAFWVSMEKCRIATIKAPFEFSFIK